MSLLLVFGCAGGAVLTAFLAPLVLTVGRWQMLHPRLALTAWLASFFLGILLVLTALLVSIVGAVTASSVHPHTEAVLLTAAAWLGLGGFGAAIAFITASASTVVAHDGVTERAFTALACSREERSHFTLVRFESDQHVACAVPGRHPEILVSTAMEAALSLPQLHAVLAHEYAHLRGRHGWAIRIARVNAACLPNTRPGQAFQQAMRLLIELAADDTAARQAGPANLANALSTLAEITDAEGMRLRAERLAARRWPPSKQRRLPEAVRIAASA
ncbi:M56 family metallopeptidase [Micrococcus sp. FDAARGOS_333]|uniref:M56 family metallopeptidase n=1 Tax=Micrococcus sp. FDAARGOS_333 TaxID=1930558 RepID=UPI000B4E6A2D|nr:M56 family metallopeptidase [Micrococcus sp. FDAARGOS_333]PNL16950.1 M56 family peptidase [Micrococcus sp. FDAARGOS_333]